MMGSDENKKTVRASELALKSLRKVHNDLCAITPSSKLTAKQIQSLRSNVLSAIPLFDELSDWACKRRERGLDNEGWADVSMLPRTLIFGDGTTAEIDVSVTLKSSGKVIPVKYGSGYFYAEIEDPKTGRTVTCDYTPDVKKWRLR